MAAGLVACKGMLIINRKKKEKRNGIKNIITRRKKIWEKTEDDWKPAIKKSDRLNCYCPG